MDPKYKGMLPEASTPLGFHKKMSNRTRDSLYDTIEASGDLYVSL